MTLGEQDDGVYSLKTYFRDIAGNLRTADDVVTIIIDTDVARASNPDLIDASDSGVSNSDNITKIRELIYIGRAGFGGGDPDVSVDASQEFAGAANNGDTVYLYYDDAGTIKTVGTGIVGAITSGAWTVTTSTMDDGSFNIRAKFRDKAGNVSDDGSFRTTLVVDNTVAPTTKPSLAVDAGVSSTDFLISNNRVSLSFESERQTNVAIVATHTQLGQNVTVGTMFIPTQGEWTINTNPLPHDGTYQFSAVFTDQSNNVQTVENIQNIVLDTTIANTGVVSINPTVTDDTGISANDNITKNVTPILVGRGGLQNDTVFIVDSNDVTIGSNIIGAQGNWTITQTSFNDGEHSLTTIYKDDAGNERRTGIVEIVIDTTIASQDNLVLVTDLGDFDNDNLTSAVNPFISGVTGDPGDTVYLVVNGVTAAQGARIGRDGTWTVPAQNLTDASHEIGAIIKDSAGNIKDVPTLIITVDLSIHNPTNLNLSSLNIDDTGFSSEDRYTANQAPTFYGQGGEQGDTVTVYNNSNNQTLGTHIINNPQARWTVSLSQSLDDGFHNVRVRYTNKAGFVVNVADGIGITIDTTIDTITAPSLTIDPGISDSDNIIAANRPSFFGYSEVADDTVTLYSGTDTIGTVLTRAQTNWTLTANTVLADRSHNISVKYSDSAGNVRQTDAVTITIDSTIESFVKGQLNPTNIMDTGASSTDGLTQNRKPVIVARDESGQQGDTVTIMFNNETYGSQILGSSRRWTISAERPNQAQLEAGVYQFQTIYTDDAGNQRSAGITTIIIDIEANRASRPELLNPTSNDANIAATKQDSIIMRGAAATQIETVNPITGEVVRTDKPFAADQRDIVTLFKNGNTLATLGVSSDGYWTYSTAAFSDSTYTIEAQLKDFAGNISASKSLVRTLIIDTTIPTIQGGATLSAATDTGVSSTDNITKLSEVVFKNEGKLGDTVSLYFDGLATAHTTIVTGSHWQLTYSFSQEGEHTVKTVYADTAGNTRIVDSDYTFFIDQTIQNVANAPSLYVDSDTGEANGDFLTFNSEPTFVGQGGEPGNTVYIFSNRDGTYGTFLTAANLKWTISARDNFALSDGSHQITVVYEDNVSNFRTGLSINVMIDTTINSISLVNLADNSDTGINSIDNLTNKNIPILTGQTGKQHDTVILYTGNDTVGSLVTDSQGKWTITSIYNFANSKGENGHTYIIKAEYFDYAGNIRSRSDFTIIIDDQITSGEDLKVDGALTEVGSNHYYINQTNPIITGKFSENIAGFSYGNNNMTAFVTANGLTIGSSVALSDGISWSVQANTMLTDDTYVVNAIFRDAAGNQVSLAQAEIITVVIDTTISSTSSAIVSLNIDSDTKGINTGVQNDDLTYDSRAVFIGSGGETSPASRASTAFVYADQRLVGTSLVLNNNYTIDALTSASALPLADGTHLISVKMRDFAGNESVNTAANFTLVIDTTINTITTPDLVASTDTGISNRDNLTNAQTIAFSGMGGEIGDTARLYQDGTQVGSIVINDGNWVVTANSIIQSTYQFTSQYSFRVFDYAGNERTSQAALSVDFDYSIPANVYTDIVDSEDKILKIHNDTGTYSEDYIFNNPVPIFIGKHDDNGDTVTLNDPLGALIGTYIVRGNEWTITSRVNFSTDGVYAIQSSFKDDAGNIRARDAVTITIDTAGPTASQPRTQNALDSGIIGDNITQNTVQVFSGQRGGGRLQFSVNDDDTVQLYSANTLIATAVASNDGFWRVTATISVDGTYQITAKLRDVAGNLGTSSAVTEIVIDTTVTSISGITMQASSDGGVSDSDRITKMAPMLTGLAGEANTTVRIMEGTNLFGQTSSDSNGTWTITALTGLSDRTYYFKAVYEDITANIRTDTNITTIVIDTTVDVASMPDLDKSSDLGASDTDNLTYVTKGTFIGNSNGDDTVVLFNGSQTLGSAIAAGSGRWTVTSLHTALKDNTANIVTAIYYDNAGNIRTVADGLTIIIDTTVSSASRAVFDASSDIGDFSDDRITSIGTPNFSGNTGDEGDTVIIFDQTAGLTIGSALVTGGNWVISSSFAIDGDFQVKTKYVDDAGNVRNVAGVSTLTIDRTIDSFSAAIIRASDDSHNSDLGNAATTDYITFNSKPLFIGQGGLENDTVTVILGGSNLGSQLIGASRRWSFSSPTILADGNYILETRFADKAGNVREAELKTVVIDTTINNRQVGGLISIDDTGVQNDGITNNRKFALHGSVDKVGDTVYAYDVKTSAYIGSTLVKSNNTWTISANSNVIDTTFEVQMQFKDTAGNYREESIFTIIVDSTLEQIATLQIDPDDDTGRKRDGVTYVSRPVFQGEGGKAGDTVYLNNLIGSAQDQVFTIIRADGTWSFTSPLLNDGEYVFEVQYKDTAGNIQTHQPINIID